MWWTRGAIAGVALLLAACAPVVPTGPSVMVLPGGGKSLEAFQADDGACRPWATQQVPAGGDAWMMQRHYDIAYQQCMYSRGNELPGFSRPGAAPRSGPAAGPGQRVPTPPPGAATPPPGTPPPPPPPPGSPPR
jgi:hypothetical protein